MATWDSSAARLFQSLDEDEGVRVLGVLMAGVGEVAGFLARGLDPGFDHRFDRRGRARLELELDDQAERLGLGP